MNEFWQSFLAFNTNAINSLLYAISKSLWYVLGLAGLCVIAYLDLKAHTKNIVKDDRRII